LREVTWALRGSLPERSGTRLIWLRGAGLLSAGPELFYDGPIIGMPLKLPPISTKVGAPLKNILVPLDASKLAEQMIERAVELGRLTGAGYTFLSVIKPVPTIGFPTGSASLDAEVQNNLSQMDALQEQQRKEALAYLDSVAKPLRTQGLRVETKVVVEERPDVAILQEAVVPAVDLVAIETHGRRGLSRLILGSVADKVIRGAAVPVLVHRPRHG
jgi:nucleotide-binding universal stress UspA family protein